MTDKYDIERYKGTTRSEESVIKTESGDVKVTFFEVADEFIDKELQHQAADFIWFAGKETLFETKKINLELEINTLKGQLWKDIIKESPSLRVKDIEAQIEADPAMSKLRLKYLEIDHALRQWATIRKAFEMKARMIQSKVGLMRSQIDRQMEQNRGMNVPKINKE